MPCLKQRSHPAASLHCCALRQGRDPLIEHFRASKFPSEDMDYMPLVYTQVSPVQQVLFGIFSVF